MDIFQMVLTVVGSVIASSGFWAFIQKRSERKDKKTKLLLGLAHDRIISLGMRYVTRGWISEDEFEDLNEYLYIPYHDAGGNGSAERVMNEVKKLDLRTRTQIDYQQFNSGGNDNEQ